MHHSPCLCNQLPDSFRESYFTLLGSKLICFINTFHPKLLLVSWVKVMSATNHVGPDDIGRKQCGPQTMAISAACKVHVGLKKV